MARTLPVVVCAAALLSMGIMLSLRGASPDKVPIPAETDQNVAASDSDQSQWRYVRIWTEGGETFREEGVLPLPPGFQSSDRPYLFPTDQMYRSLPEPVKPRWREPLQVTPPKRDR